jgi:hypothetical protein
MSDLKVVHALMGGLERKCMSPDQEPNLPSAIDVQRAVGTARSCGGGSASALVGAPWKGS